MTERGTVSQPGSEQVHHAGRVALGRFRATPADPGFGHGVTTRALVVFPRTAVAIRHRDHDEVVADPATVMLYNRGDVYDRRPIDPTGDHCEWWSIPDEWWARLAREVDPDGHLTDPRPERGRIFGSDHCPSPGVTWLRQRTLARRLVNAELDDLGVEDTALDILRSVLGAWSDGPDGWPLRWTPTATTRRRHARLVADTKEVLACRLGDDLSLDDLAGAVGSSPYHLCRLFRAHTGRTVHQHRTQLRLRASLDTLVDRDLAAIANDLGFSSHSHFTATFRRSFGTTPSQVRKILTA